MEKGGGGGGGGGGEGREGRDKFIFTTIFSTIMHIHNICTTLF